MPIEIVRSSCEEAEKVMQKDKKLLESLRSHPQTFLHFYTFDKPSITYGYFIDPQLYLNQEAIKKASVVAAKRPTGGGILFHGQDLTFSFILPSLHPKFTTSTIENYAQVHKIICKALLAFGVEKSDLTLFQQPLDAKEKDCSNFCMGYPTVEDILWKGKKIAGGAQRRTRFGFLHQGSLSLKHYKNEFVLPLLKENSSIKTAQAMTQNSVGLLDDGSIKLKIEDLQNAFIDAFLNFY